MVDDVWLKMCDKRFSSFPNITIDQIAKYVKEVVSGTEQRGEKGFTATLTDLGHQFPKNIILYGDPSESEDMLNLSEQQWLDVDIFEQKRAIHLPMFEQLVRRR